MARLGDYVRIRTGKLDANASSQNGKYPFFTCAVEPLKIDTYSYECECVLVAGNGDLNVKYYNGKFDAYQRTYIIESLDKNVLTVPYLYCFLDKYVETLRQQAIGGVIKYIKLGNLTEAEIPIPTIEEQQNIVRNIQKVNHLIALRRGQLAKLDQLVKSQFIELFYNKGYSQTTIGELVAVKISTAKKSFLDTDVIKYVDISSIDNKRNVMTGFTEYVLGDAPSRAKQHIQKDDILVSTVRPNLRNVAITAYDDDNLIASSGFCVLRAEKCLPSYLMAVVCSDDFTDAMTKVVTGANYPAIKDSDVKGYTVSLPPIKLQEQFAAFVEQTDKSKLTIEASLDKLELLKQSLMQEHFG